MQIYSSCRSIYFSYLHACLRLINIHVFLIYAYLFLIRINLFFFIYAYLCLIQNISISHTCRSIPHTHITISHICIWDLFLIYAYGVATVSRIDKLIGLFCRILSLLQGSFAKGAFNLIDPTNQSHPISILHVLWGGYS